MKLYTHIFPIDDYSICKKFRCHVPKLRFYLVKRVGVDHEQMDTVSDAHSDSVHRKMSLLLEDLFGKFSEKGRVRRRRKRKNRTGNYETSESL